MPDTLDPTPATVVTTPPSYEPPPPPPRKRRRWGRFVLYVLALLGVLLITLVVMGIMREKSQPKLVAINQAETIDQTMTRAYGKYSPEKKGYLYVGEGNRPFLVRVIQQAKIESVGANDELYFATSGAPLDGGAGFIYGVFQIRADAAAKDGSLVEISSPYRAGGEVALTPENVHFEALAEHTWAWVVKIQDGAESETAIVVTRNVILAPHGDQIAVLAGFQAAADLDSGDCAKSNADYVKQAEAAAKLKKLGDNASEEERNALLALAEGEEQGCMHMRWSYRTAPVAGDLPGPLTITSSGSEHGDTVVPKTWKLIFDSKAFSYIVPAELEAGNESAEVPATT